MVVASKRKPLNRAARKQMKMIASKGCGHARLGRLAWLAPRLRDRIDARFESGNTVPVERAHITMTEWQTIKKLLT